MKKTLVIMGTHPNGLKTFEWGRTDCDIWMFNEAPNAKKTNGELAYPKCDACFQLHHEAIWKNPKNRSDEKHYQWLASGKTPTVLNFIRTGRELIKEDLIDYKNENNVISCRVYQLAT